MTQKEIYEMYMNGELLTLESTLKINNDAIEQARNTAYKECAEICRQVVGLRLPIMDGADQSYCHGAKDCMENIKEKIK